MPKRPRKNNNTPFFHIIVQGINKEFIFNSKHFIQKYLSYLSKFSNSYSITLLAYCMMGNHVHLLLHTESISQLSSFMKIVNQSFAQYYNFKNKRVGYVFRSRFLSEPIYHQRYLLTCLSYIHNNPVKAGIVNNCFEYAYSSFLDYISNTNLATPKSIKLLFGDNLNYLPIYYQIHKQNSYFLDIDLYPFQIITSKINDFEIQISTPLSEIFQQPPLLKQLIYYLKDSYSPIILPNKEIANCLHLSLEQLKYILRQKNR